MYYLLVQDPFITPASYRTRAIISEEDERQFHAARWICSKVLKKPKNDIIIEFWGKGERDYCDFCLESIPIFSFTFIEALQQAGVDNIQFIEIQTKHSDGKETELKYKAVNILNRLDCIQLAEPDYIDSSLKRELAIDEEKANGALFFRPVLSPSTIVVHKSVKEHLESKKLKYLSFRKIGPIARQ